jgi:hypothetical protein
LVLKGPASSGKTFLARALRSLIDPATVPARRLPERDRELMELAYQNWVLIFDQVHRIAPRISDALCAVSSGDAFEIAQSDGRDPMVFQIARPLILTTPSDETLPAWIPARNLSNRSIEVKLAPIAALRPEAELWSALEAQRPALLAALCDAVSSALSRIHDVDAGNVARLADSAAWAMAAAPALSISEAAVLDTFNNPESIWVGSDPVREAIFALVPPTQTWTGNAAALLAHMRAAIPLATLPSTIQGLSRLLMRVPGIQVEKSKGADGQRIMSITRVPGASQYFLGARS